MENYDFSVEDCGSLFMVTPENDNALEWWEAHTDAQSLGRSYAVEHRYIQELTGGMLEAGFRVTKDGKEVKVSETTGDLILV